MPDTATATPTFLYPEDNKVIAQSGSFAVDFTLPEAALADSVKLTLTRMSGTSDSGSPHIITFATAFESQGQHTMTVPALSGAASSSNIDTVTSNGGTASNLVHGATYSVKLEYQDDHSNSATSVTHTGVEVGEGCMGECCFVLTGLLLCARYRYWDTHIPIPGGQQGDSFK